MAEFASDEGTSLRQYPNGQSPCHKPHPNIDGAAQAHCVTARWGRYFRREHPDPEQVTKRGEQRRVWQRAAMAGAMSLVLLGEGPLEPWSPSVKLHECRGGRRWAGCWH